MLHPAAQWEAAGNGSTEPNAIRDHARLELRSRLCAAAAPGDEGIRKGHLALCCSQGGTACKLAGWGPSCWQHLKKQPRHAVPVNPLHQRDGVSCRSSLQPLVEANQPGLRRVRMPKGMGWCPHGCHRSCAPRAPISHPGLLYPGHLPTVQGTAETT